MTTTFTPIDAANSGFTSILSIDDIQIKPKFQMRVEGTNPDIVEKYATIMRANDPEGWQAFPLIKVLCDSNAQEPSYYLLGGFHRIEAMKQNQYESIQVAIIAGTQRDGLLIAFGENSDRSFRRTNHDIQHMIEAIFKDPELRGWSNSFLATRLGVDRQTITNHERRLIEDPPNWWEPRPDELKYIDRYGNISLRKHNPPSSATADNVVLMPAGNLMHHDDVLEDIERREILSEIGNIYYKVDPIYVSGEPMERMRQREQIANEYPEYAQYNDRETLPMESLRAMKSSLEKILERGEEYRRTLNDEIYDIGKKIESLFPADMSWRWFEKTNLKDEYPDLQYLDNRYWEAIPNLEVLKVCMLELFNRINTEGSDKFLPADYYEIEEEVEAHGDDFDSLKEASKQAYDNAEEAFMRLIGPPDLSRYDYYLGKRWDWLVAKAKKQMRDVNFPKRDSWYHELTKNDDPVQIQGYIDAWNALTQALIERPDWVRDAFYEAACVMSTFQIKLVFRTDIARIDSYEDFEFEASCPLSDSELEEIYNAATDAAVAKYFELTGGKYRKV